MPLLNRLLARTSKVGLPPADRPDLSLCWLWQGATDRNGYGVFHHRQPGTNFAHRLMYEALVGPIPQGLVIDHLCRVPACCNPDHLEPVTHAENVRRGRGVEVSRRLAAARTHCPNGHLYEDGSFRINERGPKKGRRRCLVCSRALNRKYRAAHQQDGDQ
ncbi:HNH endonuclease signature motif containing protein [Streptomyces subrutilus]|uniref:HNH endonuclease signature motif containing protein n=1 Tax=Streptomyces subrutilus TaxID=36818 RepID=UPI002E0F4F72|nr:HNH endonuclease [Streptomyces subrutilus]